ncbi:Two-component response regulator-like [Castilleja foliolosa]|uniref:Two-component response regulator-like n=1 Tax=Castilleja foliolosa TaxID=1961234 RepID=A0ABD3BZR7_9LAMI
MKIDVNGGERELLDEDKGFQDGISCGSKISFHSVGFKSTANRQQHQPQNTTEHWEKFLHVRSIRVMLVENDDSTRHVVTALLRNCNYEVIEASNGLQARKILEDLTNHIDIVLTEVVIPHLSGVALLRKITNHKTRKNIPVIMMSSHDSMGLVFSCLSKGAVDFLVKPMRKNELKNFWQHVWRRCQSSSGSGSGSESGTQTHKSVKSKISRKGNNSGSDDGENNGSNGLNVGDGSDDGNGAQSSWRKQIVEFDSSRSVSPIDQVTDCPDSTCGQVIRPNTQNSGNKGVDINVVAREAHEQSQPAMWLQCGDITAAEAATGEISSERDINSFLLGLFLLKRSDYAPARKPQKTATRSRNGGLSNRPVILETGGKYKEKGNLIDNAKWSMASKQAGMGRLNLTGECLYNKYKDSSAKLSAHPINGKESGTNEPNFDFSLKRLRGVQDTGGSGQVDRCVWRRSELSAFSRYNAASNIFKAPDGITGSSSLIGNHAEAAKRGPVSDLQIHSTEHLVYQCPYKAYNNIDIGSTTDKPETASTMNFLPQISPNLPNESSLTKLAKDAPQCGSTNDLNGAIDCSNLVNDSLNRSGSGSNHGRSNAVNTTGTTCKKSDFGQGRESGSGDASGSGSGTVVDENKRTIRQAALVKFRQMRKERSLRKKVANLKLAIVVSFSYLILLQSTVFFWDNYKYCLWGIS